ncbi:MAG TPA: RNA 2',3'-cyclic phosphodiesterase [Bacillales bacterium]|nr:RNA 2',3'-cyclic phosphodiesterase [Bacillales bacterium]
MNEPAGHFFLAVPLPDPERERLSQQAQSLKRELPYKHWPDPRDYHVTLAFLGAAGFQKINETKQAVARAVEHCIPFSMALNGLGTFGKTEQPRVLWAGVDADSPLHDLQRSVHGACQSVGFELDKRPYRPHITLAKKWSGPETLDRTILTSGLQSDPWQVKAIVLYQTHLQRTPRYQPLKFFPLAADKKDTR